MMTRQNEESERDESGDELNTEIHGVTKYEMNQETHMEMTT